MRTVRRSCTVAAGIVTSLIAMTAFASSALASYSNDPQSIAWRADGPVHAITATGNRIYVGGLFGGGGIAALNAGTGALIWTVPTNGDVRSIALSDDGTELVAGGFFTSAGGATHRHLVKIATASGSVFGTWKAAASSNVRALAIMGNHVYVGGTFKMLDGTAGRGLGAVLLSTGKHDGSFSANVDKNVWSMALSGTRLIAAGNFTLADGHARASIAMFDLNNGGALTDWAPARLCTGCNSYWSIAVNATNVFVGTSGPGGSFGAFNLSTGQTPWHYLRADGDVQAVSMGPDGLVYIGGHFNKHVGSATPRHLLAAVNPANGAVDPNFTPRLITSFPGVWALTTTPGALYAGGSFTGAIDQGKNNHVPYFAAFAN